MIKHPTHEKILQRNRYIIGELRPSNVPVSLAELISLLVDGAVGVRDASRYLKDRYREQAVPNWRDLTEQEICEYVRLAIKFHQQRQWMKEAEIVSRKEKKKLEQSEPPSQNKQSVDERIRKLKDTMERCERQLRICKEEELFVKKREELLLMRKEMKYLQPPENLLASRLFEDNQTADSVSPEVAQSVQSIMSRKKATSCSKSESTSPKHRVVNMRRLQALYNHYLRKSQKPRPTFDQLAHEDSLTVKGFMDVVKDFQLCRLLHPNEIYELFKQNSRDNKHIDFEGFVQLLRNIHRLEAAKQKIEWDEGTENRYLNANLLNTQRLDLLLHRKAYPEKFNYEFKIIPHTGKTKEQIIVELVKRRQMKLAPELPVSSSPVHYNSSKKLISKGTLCPKTKAEFKAEPKHQRRASQPNIFHRRYEREEESPQRAILKLLPTDDDPYLKAFQSHLSSSMMLPSLNKLPRMQF